MEAPPSLRRGRSRGGLSTKIHAGAGGHGRPLALVVTGGQRNDRAALETVLAGIRIPGLHAGRARTRPEAVIADRAYPAAAYRAMPHKRGITVVIPQKSDQIAARKRRGRKGGRPPGPGVEACKGRSVAERSFALARQWRALATRYDKLAITYRAAVVLSACITWTRT